MTHKDGKEQVVYFNTKKRTNDKTLSIILTCTTILAVVFSLFIIITSSIYGAAEVVGLSMAPTINAPEFFGNTQTKNQIAFYTSTKTAHTGDIVIVDYQNANIKEIEAIKRIVAVGGDQICYYNGHLMINGKPANEPYLQTAFEIIKKEQGLIAAKNFEQKAFLQSKKLFDNFCKQLLDGTTDITTTFSTNYASNYAGSITYNSTIDSYVLTIPQGFVFVLGDNRANSIDSNTFGPVETKYITSKVDYLAPYGSNIFQAMWLQFAK